MGGTDGWELTVVLGAEPGLLQERQVLLAQALSPPQALPFDSPCTEGPNTFQGIHPGSVPSRRLLKYLGAASFTPMSQYFRLRDICRVSFCPDGHPYPTLPCCPAAFPKAQCMMVLCEGRSLLFCSDAIVLRNQLLTQKGAIFAQAGSEMLTQHPVQDGSPILAASLF